MIELTQQDIDRFWAKVDTSNVDGCWVWIGGHDTEEYGRFYHKSRHHPYGAHVISYIIKYGKAPEQDVLHSCDNPSCVRPDHLFEGTQADNNRDRDLKGRHVALKGEENGFHRLSAEQADEIRLRYGPPRGKGSRQKPTLKELAIEYGVHHTTVRDVVIGKNWNG